MATWLIVVLCIIGVMVITAVAGVVVPQLLTFIDYLRNGSPLG